MASEDLKIIIKQKGTIPVWTKTKVGVDQEVGDGKITIMQGDVEKGSFKLNQNESETIYLDEGGSTDNITINQNSNDELQAIGLINKNTENGAVNPVYDWVGTLQEFTEQNVATEHPDWICYITDDAGVVDGIYTASQCDALFARIADVYTRSQANELFSTKANTNDVYTKAEIDTIESGKANIDASNFTTTGTTFLSAQGMPSAYRESVTLLASGSEYTAPANGWWYFTGQLGAGSGTSNQILMYERDFIEGNNLTARVLAPTAAASYPAILPARAGSKLVLNYASTSAAPNWLFFFHYAEGNPGE